MDEDHQKFIQNPKLLINRKVFGLFGSNIIYRIINIEEIPEDPLKIKISLVKLENNLFMERTIQKTELNNLSFVSDLSFTGDPQKFFMYIMGLAIRSNFTQDPLYAVGSSKIDPLPHQLEAIYRYALPRHKIRFLIADEPGAGKTIMAGILIKELIARSETKRILIIVPGALTGQWKRELKNRFNEDFTIIDSDLVKNIGPRAWTQFDKIITSIDFAKNEVQQKKLKGKREIRNSLIGITWDLTIVDEAHKMNAEWNMRRMVTKSTKRYRLGAIISENSEHLLFLTATPHKGKSDSFRLLLKLLEPDAFDEMDTDITPILEQYKEQGFPIFIRRLKEEMITADRKPIFPGRTAETIEFILSPLESVLYKQVSEYVKTIFNLAKQIEGQRSNAIGFMLKLLQRRLNSSMRSIHRTLIHRKERLESIFNNPDFDKSIRELQLRIIELSQEAEDAELNDDVPPKKIEDLYNEISCLTMATNREELEIEIKKLDALIQAAKEAEAQQCESKLSSVLSLIEKKLGEEQLIIFTEYKDTLDYLHEKIPSNFEVGEIHGEMNEAARKDVQEKFWNREIQILLCTDAASEGINLQCCWNLINYDIPWNPNRLEQRMGRIHRYLQNHFCTFYNLVGTKTNDGEPIVEGLVVAKIFEKLKIMREELGSDRVFDVIGTFFEELKFGELLEKSLNAEQIDYSKEIIEVPNERIKDILGPKSNVDIGLEFFIKQRQKSEDNRLWPKYLAEYVQFGFFYANSVIQFKGSGPFTISQLPFKINTQIKLNEIKYGPLPYRNFQITFNKPMERSLLESKTDIEYVTAGHPLLESVIDIALKDGRDALQLGTILLDPSHGFHGILWFIEISFTDGSMIKEIQHRVLIIFTPFKDVNSFDLKSLSYETLSPLILWDFRRDISSIAQIDLIPYIAFFNATRSYLTEVIGNQLCTQDEVDLRDLREKAKILKLDALNRRETRDRIRLEKEISLLFDLEDKGEDVSQKITEKEAERNNLQEQIKDFRKNTERDCHVSRQSPKLLSAAIIIPAHDNGSPAENLDEAKLLADTHAIDLAAMQAVIKYEQARGWIVLDKSHIKCGYDLESSNPKDSTDIRHIEVKGHVGEEDIFITPNEWLKAQNDQSGRYWLYIVNKALENPEIILIQDPASKFNPEVIITEKYKIPLGQIKSFY